MSEPVRTGFAFGRFEYDGAQAKLFLAGREVPLTARELHLLAIFLSRPGEWLEDAWLERGLWPKAVPPTGELDRLVRALTAALDEGADGVATIQTLKKRGYRLLIPVRALTPPTPAAASGAVSGATAGAVSGPTSGASAGARAGAASAAAPGGKPDAMPAAPGSALSAASESAAEATAGAASGPAASGERAGLDGTRAGGRSARRAAVSRGQLTLGLLALGVAILALLWWQGPPGAADVGFAARASNAADPAAMRAAAAAELGKGLAAAPLFDLASRRAAISHFEAALQLDAGARNQAAAHAALASVLVREGEMERARLEAQAALASNIALGEGARLAEPLAALAFTQLFLGRDPAAARASAERALAIDALHIGARRALVWVCAVEGRFDLALQELAPARLPGQFDPEVSTDEAWVLYLAGRPLEARQMLSAVVRQEPLFRRAHAALAALHLSERRLAAAAVEFELLDTLNSGAGDGRGDDVRRSLRDTDSWALPDASEAARLLEDRAAGALKRLAPGPGEAGPSSAVGLGTAIEAARIYAQFGESAQAIAALGRALAGREPGATLARVDPAFFPLRGDAAFRRLLDSAGVPALVRSAPAR